MRNVFVSPPPPHLSDAERNRHPSWRRTTRHYRKKQRVVRNVWIVSGLLMIPAPLGVVLVLAMGTTMLAFAILDETP